MAGRGKRYRELYERVDREAVYEPSEAVSLIKSMQSAKFSETVEVHIRTGLNVRHADEQLRGTISLPHGVGKEQKVAVFAKGDKAREAQEAGAEYAGGDDLAKKVQEGMLDFEVCIATPDMMGTVGKLGRILGPRGLMPNPKVGTVTADVGRAVREAKAGKVEYRVDKAGVVHCRVGRVSFDPQKLTDNTLALIRELVAKKPSTAKGVYLRSITLSSTMGPGVRIDPSVVAAKEGEES